MSLHTPKQITPEYYLFQIVAKMELYRCRCQLRTKSKWDMGYKEQQEAERLKAMLLRIYQCKKPFELLVIDKKPKTRMGCYVVGRKRIRIYSKYKSECPLEEIAIHEYAHHIHRTEQYGNDYRRRDRSHGEKFWRIYSALRAKAQKLGVFDDELVSDIIK